MKAMKFLAVFMVLAMLLTACGQAAATEAPVAATEAPVAATEAPVAGGAPEACADALGCAVFEAGDVIKIGMGAPMTGGNASYGIDISQGATIAMSDAGDIEGWTFALDAQDDGGTAEGGAAVANKFAADPAIVAVAGHIFSGATAAAMPIYEKVGIPMLSPSATNPPLTASGSTVFNRIAFTDLNQGNNAADFIYNTLGVKKMAVLHDGSDYGKGLADIVAAQFVKDGGEVVIEQAITPGESDYTAVLSTVAAKTPDAIYFGGYTAEGAVLVNQMKTTGLENAKFFGCDGTYGEDFLTRTGANGEGAYASIAPASPDSDAKLTFNAAYLEKFGKEAGSLSPYTWAGYDAAAALAATVKQVAVVADGKLYIPRAALVAAVRSLSNYVGLSGTFTCQSNGECNTDKPQFVVVKDGAWTNAE
ncbi:MAG: branched chain amino acid ABC transporter substrate-binding protein [Chloroflexi bacterium HGW-Chloroflexi-4]|jgi:branched-chain amino acid transport system substrate-binding protein|nr:MAG: branched chain amino acid ABC transporter substrate-binding protein [Chloroflexi bacterium HGW-Chloroflexi-4]